MFRRPLLAPAVAAATVATTMLSAAVVLTPRPAAGFDALVPPDGTTNLLVAPGGESIQVETVLRKGWIFGLNDPAVAPMAWDILFAGTPHDPWMVETLTGARDRTTISSLGPEGISTISATYDGATMIFPEGRDDAPAGSPARWRDSGPVTVMVDGSTVEATFTLTATASDAPNGCRTVSFEDVVLFPDDREVATSRVETRCPGRGLVTLTVGGEQWSASGQPPSREFSTVSDDGPQPLVPTEIVPLTFTDAPGYLDIYQAAIPVGRERLVMTLPMTQDIYSVNRSGDELSMGWTAHPGGAITAFGVFGDVTVVATSQLAAVAYESEGFQIWSVELPEVCSAGPVRLDDATLVMGCRDGTLRALDIATGETRWSVPLHAEIQDAPVVQDGLVIAVDITDTLTAIRDGEVVWEAELDSGFQDMTVPTLGHAVLVSELGMSDLLYFDLTTGERYDGGWYSSGDGLLPLPDGALVLSFRGAETVGPSPGPSYQGEIRSATSSDAAIIVDDGLNVVVATRRGTEILGPAAPPDDVYTFWADGDGEWILSGGDGMFWSVR